MKTAPNSTQPLAALQRRSHRTLAEEAVEALSAPIRSGQLQPGDKLPTESAIMQQLGVSRTVVREAISRLQASGLVETRHGIGTFVSDPADMPLHIPVSAVTTARDALALLELREAVEVEAARLAAQRRTPAQLQTIRQALDTLVALEMAAAKTYSAKSGSDPISAEMGSDPDFLPVQRAVDADYAFHRAVAEATANSYFLAFLTQLGRAAIPRSRLSIDAAAHRQYLHTLNQEHEALYQAIAAQDAAAASQAARAHLGNSRRRLQRALEAQGGA